MNKSIYKSQNYLEADLILRSEGTLFSYYDELDGFYLLNASIKRVIPDATQKKVYYDLESPYGYGGFETNITDKTMLHSFLERYKKACLNEGIVAEFFRNNPLNSFALNNRALFDFYCVERETVVVELQTDFKVHYKGSLKRNINKAKSNELLVIQVDLNEYVSQFFTLYTKTMKKNNATDFYFFSEAYFEHLAKNEHVACFAVLYQNNIINMVIVLLEENHVYYHLGATDPEYYFLNSNPLIFDFLFDFYCKEGYLLFYLGGGNSTEAENSLLKFKQKFSSVSLPFIISGLIFDQKHYDYLCLNAPSTAQRFFLQYR